MKGIKRRVGEREMELESEKESDDESHSTLKRAQNGMTENKKKFLKKGDLYKPPTNDELNLLKETENVYHSNIFRLQVKELLKEVILKGKRKKQLDDFLHSLNQKLLKLKDVKIKDATETSWLPSNIRLPVMFKKSQVKGKLVLSKPSSIKVVGSYLLGATIKPMLNVDVAVTCPEGFIQPKDHLNFQYHHKRAIYLAYIAAKLHQWPEIDQLKFSSDHHMTPVLKMTPKGKIGNSVIINIRPCLEEGVFDAATLQPSRGHISKKWFNSSLEKPPDNFPATPHYNSSILRDIGLQQHLRILFEAALDFRGMTDAIILLKIWLHQRQLDKGYGSFNGFIMSMLVVHLLNIKRLNKIMSANQVFKNVLSYLATTNWTESGISINKVFQEGLPSLANFHAHFDVVFIDSTGYLNLCADVNKHVYEEVRKEAELAVRILDDKICDSFQCLFMTPLPFTARFDHLFHISNLSQLKNVCEMHLFGDQCMDLGGNYVQTSLPKLLEILQDGLDKRVHFIGLKARETKEWSISSPPPAFSDGHLTFGLHLNPQFSSNVLDKGPESNTQMATIFRKFWGDKAEMRRFQDGSICEAVLWPGKSLAEKRLVVNHVIKYILQQFASLDPESISYVGGQLDCVLKPPRLDSSSKSKVLPRGTGEEQSYSITHVYDALSKQLRALKDLPLAITSVQGVSPVFRHTEVFPARPSSLTIRIRKIHKFVQVPSPVDPCPDWIPALRVLIQFEGSGRWPDEVEAVRRIKAAFHVKVAESLHKQFQLTTYPTATHIDVLKDDYVFRLVVAHRREVHLLKEVSDASGLLMQRDNLKSQELEKQIIHLPRFTSALNGLQQQHSTFSATVRLCKRWTSAHLLSNHISEEAVELLVAYLYLSPSPYRVPSLPMVGFHRFLKLLSDHDWNSSPLIVNFNDELTVTDYEAIRNYFSNNRTHLPVLFLATAWDREGSVWTTTSPSVQILHRLILLAKESLSILERLMMSVSNPADYMQIFRPPMDSYDVLIHLKLEQLPRRHQCIDKVKSKSDPAPKPKFLPKNPPMPVVDFDPTAYYLQELNEMYGEIALFFHDVYGGNVIAVVWKPNSFKPELFKILKVNARHCVQDASSPQGVMMKPNVEAIIEDFKTLGQGLVDRVEAHTERWII
ncbi:nucleolar protein 6-like [Anneissia japonica]|uniref:nucleolar protein 6-like n=1 Tax=Anneissia japonica TaxID=1529436 RepID=UPI0014257A73|nr:nucleolar protein 6-like [Anneissia japonica]